MTNLAKEKWCFFPKQPLLQTVQQGGILHISKAQQPLSASKDPLETRPEDQLSEACWNLLHFPTGSRNEDQWGVSMGKVIYNRGIFESV